MTDASIIQTFEFGFDKMFSCKLMLRLKRPSTAVQEVLNVIKGGGGSYTGGEQQKALSGNMITVEKLSDKQTQPQIIARNAFKQFK